MSPNTVICNFFAIFVNIPQIQSLVNSFFRYILIFVCATISCTINALPAAADTPPVASDIRQMLSLASAKNQRVEIDFPMTVVFRHDKYVYVTDHYEGATLLYGDNHYHAGNVIPSGWIAICTPVNGRTQYSGAFPTSTSNAAYSIPVVATVTAEDVNRVVKLSGVSFYETTPASPKQHFTGILSSGEQLTFTNFFSLTPMSAGRYDLTVAVGVKDGEPDLYPLEYTITGTLRDRAEAPVFSPANCSFNDYVMVSISSPTPGATIYYTIDEPAPDDSSDIYTHQIKVMTTCTIRAIACAPGMMPSEVTESYYYESHDTPPQDRDHYTLFNFTEEETLQAMGAEAPDYGETLPVQNTLLFSDLVSLTCRQADSDQLPEIVHNTDGLSLSLKEGNTISFSTMKSNKYVFKIRQITFITENPDRILYNDIPVANGVWTSDSDNDPHVLTFDVADKVNLHVIEVVYTQTTGIVSPASDDDEDEEEKYYTISGIQVAKPGNGIYIVKKGDKTKKYMPKNN